MAIQMDAQVDGGSKIDVDDNSTTDEEEVDNGGVQQVFFG